MNQPDPQPAQPTTGGRAWLPSRTALLAVAIAFALGLAMFMLIWLRDRNDGFYRAPTAPGTTAGQEFEPLPAPLPAGGDSGTGTASGMGEAPARPTATGTLPASPAPLPPVMPAPVPAPVPAAAPASADQPPVPVESPAPRYPAEALRRGESGEVLLRVHVGPDGVPVAVDLVRSSHSRELDRAASEAVRRWRFRPARHAGQPVNGVVQVPISFDSGR